jgi:hypothetical protein
MKRKKAEILSETNCNCPDCLEVAMGVRLNPDHEMCQDLYLANELIAEIIIDHLRSKIRTNVIREKVFECLRQSDKFLNATDEDIWHVVGVLEQESGFEREREFIDENKLDALLDLMRKHISARLPETIENLIVKLAFEAELFADKVRHEDDGEVYTLPDEFRKLLVHDNHAQKVKEVFETGRGLTKMQRSKALSRYEDLCSMIKKAVDYHDSSYDAYCGSRNRHSREEWREIWGTNGERMYPNLPKEVVDSLSLPNRPTVAEIARHQVAKEYERSSSYMEKVLSKVRSENLS